MTSNSEVEAILEDMFLQYGPPNESNTRMYYSVVKSALSEDQQRVDLITLSLDTNIPGLLHDNRENSAQYIPQLIQYLSTKHRIDSQSAEWVVQIWAHAMGIQVPLQQVSGGQISPNDGGSINDQTVHSSSGTGKSRTLIIVSACVLGLILLGVISYVLLGAGFFGTEKSAELSMEISLAGAKQERSSVVADDALYGSYDTEKDGLQTITLTLRNVWDRPINLEDMVYNYTTPYGSGYVKSNNNKTLYPGKVELVQLNLADAGIAGPKPGEKFTLEIRSPTGAYFLIKKTLPSSFSSGLIY